jgi:hypothetical protein
LTAVVPRMYVPSATSAKPRFSRALFTPSRPARPNGACVVLTRNFSIQFSFSQLLTNVCAAPAQPRGPGRASSGSLSRSPFCIHVIPPSTVSAWPKTQSRTAPDDAERHTNSGRRSPVPKHRVQVQRDGPVLAALSELREKTVARDRILELIVHAKAKQVDHSAPAESPCCLCRARRYRRP